jgi:hypothetical protein
MKFDMPQTTDVTDDEKTNTFRFNGVWTAYLTKLRNCVVWRSQQGTTAQRPASGAGLEVGLPYFDTTLNKPIWIKTVSPVVWVDATGTSV